MLLHSPFVIGSRLLPALRIGGAELSLEWERTSHDGRDVFRWTIDLDGAEYSAADLKSGCQGCSTQQMFGTFLAFLSACGEGVNYQSRTGRESDNADLFPPSVAEWAAAHTDELSLLCCELEESSAALIDD